MDLKQNIDNTNELKNKVKLANTRIKEIVIRGGYDFKSLDKAPERINKMLGQYNKVAFATLNQKTDLRSLPTIKLNCDFDVKEVMIQIRTKGKYCSSYYINYQTLSCGKHFNGSHTIALYDEQSNARQNIIVKLSNNTVTFEKPSAPAQETEINFINYVAIG